jgi:hypothetical protein
MIFTQAYVASMCESIAYMKITDKQKEFVRAAMRAAIDYANAQHHMHTSKEAKALAVSRADGRTVSPSAPGASAPVQPLPGQSQSGPRPPGERP